MHCFNHFTWINSFNFHSNTEEGEVIPTLQMRQMTIGVFKQPAVSQLKSCRQYRERRTKGKVWSNQERKKYWLPSWQREILISQGNFSLPLVTTARLHTYSTCISAWTPTSFTCKLMCGICGNIQCQSHRGFSLRKIVFCSLQTGVFIMKCWTVSRDSPGHLI